jgi:hypothetical protein
MIFPLMPCFVSSDVPLDPPVETGTTIIRGQLGWIDKATRQMHVKCGDVDKVIVLPYNASITINGVPDRRFADFSDLNSIHVYEVMVTSYFGVTTGTKVVLRTAIPFGNRGK